MIVYAPVFDEVTRILKGWVDGFVQRYRGRVTVYIAGEGAVRERLWVALKRYPGEPVFIATHGIPSGVEDAERLPALSACSSDRLLRGHPTYLLSCWAGDVLAYTSVQKGSPAVIAYVKPVIFLLDERVVGYFRECLLAPAEAMARGFSMVQAYRYAQRKCMAMLRRLAGGSGVYREAYNALKHDIESMVLVTPEALGAAPGAAPASAAVAGVAVVAGVALIPLLLHLTK